MFSLFYFILFYIQEKKEKKRGPFKELVKIAPLLSKELNGYLEDVEILLSPFFGSDTFSIYDILLASHLWGVYVVPEFQFSETIKISPKGVGDIEVYTVKYKEKFSI